VGAGLITALAFALVACGGAAPAPAAPAVPPTTAPRPAAAPATTAAEVARCVAADLAARLGARAGDPGSGQLTVPIVYTNTSKKPCRIWGVPGVDLHGPADPNGPVYSLPRPGADQAQQRFTLVPGASATATITYLTDTPGSVGSFGSTGWVPAQVVTTPPGDTSSLTMPWTTGDTVLRQDSATRPGTFVGPLVAS
jgi:hypothetical protein